MTESEWWASAPTWAKWHTWDDLGKCWWEKRPKFTNGINRWYQYPYEDDSLANYSWYDDSPIPVELGIHPSKTLRKRPTGTSAQEVEGNED